MSGVNVLRSYPGLGNEVRRIGVKAMIPWFKGEEFTTYMQNKQRAMYLIQACLDFPATSINNPLAVVLNRDPRPEEFKRRSIAYLYAFRRLMTKEHLSSIEIENMELLLNLFPTSLLFRVFLTDMKDIIKTFGDGERSGYAVALGDIQKKDERLVRLFIRGQFISMLSDQALRTNYDILLKGSLEEAVDTMNGVRDIDKHSSEIWKIITKIALNLHDRTQYAKIFEKLYRITNFLDQKVKPTMRRNLTDLFIGKGLSRDTAQKIIAEVTAEEATHPSSGTGIPGAQRAAYVIDALQKNYGDDIFTNKAKAVVVVDELSKLLNDPREDNIAKWIYQGIISLLDKMY